MTANQTMIHASGDMADRVRAFPWEGTPLGAIRGWSQELLCAVNLLLFSPAPTFLYWGPNLIGLYNDAFAPFLEGKTPRKSGPTRQDDLERDLAHHRCPVSRCS